MAKNCTSTSTKSTFCLVSSIVLLFMILQIRVVECRALKSTTTPTSNTIAPNCVQPGIEAANTVVVAQFGVATSSNDSSTTSGSSNDDDSAARSFMVKLASGPSRRGPGH